VRGEDALGGICLNWGCIPTKALLESAAMITHLGHAKEFGVTVGEIKTDLAQAVKRSRQVSERLVKGIGFLFKKNKITHLPGRGRLAGTGQGGGDGEGRAQVDRSRPSTSSSPPAPSRATCRSCASTTTACGTPPTP
jgi:dihydrolipoamide dehydrogenase